MVFKKRGTPKIILGIETSCDETAAAVCQKIDHRVHILSNVVASSAALQAKYGGIIPEQAAREQLKSIIPVIQEALQIAKINPQEIDAIAVTQGPGLIGSLLVGVETAKVLSLSWQKPLVPINHLIGHFYANWIKFPPLATGHLPQFPAVGLLVSGGHTDLVLFEDHGKYKYLGGTRDDAAGEAFDKTARILGLPYPGGPVIAKRAKRGNPQAFSLPRPMIDSEDLDFSFSGLKTAVANIVHSLRFKVSSTDKQSTNELINNLSASIQEAIIDVLVAKTIKAAQIFQVTQILLAGGVAANQKLVETMSLVVQKNFSHVRLFVPPPYLCTDNAAMIAATAFYNYHPINPLILQANPNLSFAH